MPNPIAYPRAIVHFDGDSFFASIEQSLNYTLRGKVVVTGGERGAATSVSIEGKRLGLSRGMSLTDMKRICPELVVVGSDYTSYSIYAKRMYAIAKQFTPLVEEYSIDECFADITGLDVVYEMSYEQIAEGIKNRLEGDLGITFGVGLAPNKTLAKIASKKNKPSGLAYIPRNGIEPFLKDLPVGALWGMGQSITVALQKLGVYTALEFAQKDAYWLSEHALSKPYRQIWLELQGEFARTLTVTSEDTIGSILKSFTIPPTNDKEVLLSHLAKNVEAACTKARRHGVRARLARFYLKNQDFHYFSYAADVPVGTNDPREFLTLIEKHFTAVYTPGMLYRTTGFSLHNLSTVITEDLFGESARITDRQPALTVLDAVNKKYGNNTMFLGASLTSLVREGVRSAERAKRARKRIVLGGPYRRKKLGIPYLGVAH